MIKIYKNTGELRAIVQPTESSEQICELQGQDMVKLSFSLPLPVNFQINDFALIFEKKYTLNTPPTVNKIANRNYGYLLNLESDIQNIGKVLFLFFDRYNRFTDSEFSMTGDAKAFLDLVILNVNRIYPSYNYKIGFVLASDTKTLDFSGNNCLEVLGMLANAFETEWVIEDNKISLYKKQTNSGISLGYGKGKGLISLTVAPQTNTNPITRLYAYGSDKNLGSNYRLGAKRLRMPDSLYLEKNVDKYGVIEIRKEFEDIFPHRIGTVSAVASPFIFTDNVIDFNVNDWLIGGVKAKISFTTGQLTGYTFDINTYNHTTKTFTINKNTDSQTTEIPSSLLSPAIGDNYVLIDILMPNSYITNAEAKLKQTAQEYLDKIAGDVPTVLSVVADPIYFKNSGKKVQLGTVVNIYDGLMGINENKRVVKFTRNLRIDTEYTLELADEAKNNSIIKLINA